MVYFLPRIAVLALLILSLFPSIVYCQRVSFGINGNFDHSVPIKSERSRYDNSVFELKGGQTFGGGIAMNYSVNPRFSISSGLIYQPRKYHFYQNDIGFPGIGAQIRLTSVSHALEVPLLISFEGKKKFTCGIKAGVIVSYFIASKRYVKEHVPVITGSTPPDTIQHYISIIEMKDLNLSPDLYCGLSLIKKEEEKKQFEVTLGYRYSLKNSYEYYNYEAAYTKNNTQTNVFIATISPRYSIVELRINYFPKFKEKT